uniref:Uncharacterized protein n=1 Tax=Macaca fascicularis TaxID=9541 RepID=A0A7N9D4M6_MACFA
CWEMDISLLNPRNYIFELNLLIIQLEMIRLHIHNIRVMYIFLLKPCCIAAPAIMILPMKISATSL